MRLGRFEFVQAVLVCLVFAGAAADAQTVSTNHMPGTDFSKCKTYRWGTVPGGAHPNQIIDAEIKESVDKQLVAKGFRKVDGDSSDLAVTYQVALQKERQWTGFGTGVGPRLGGGMGTASSTTIDVGTIVLDFYQPEPRTLLWQGRVSDAVDPNGNQEKTEKKLDKAMKKLLKDFPPKPKK